MFVRGDVIRVGPGKIVEPSLQFHVKGGVPPVLVLDNIAESPKQIVCGEVAAAIKGDGSVTVNVLVKTQPFKSVTVVV